jgi:hypothetical protein
VDALGRAAETPPRRKRGVSSGDSPGPPPTPDEVAAREQAGRAASVILTLGALLLAVNVSCLVVYAVSDVVDLARDSSSALDGSSVQLVQAVAWAGEQLGEESRQHYCWPAVELVLTRAARGSVPALVDDTLDALRRCYPSYVAVFDRLAPRRPERCGERPASWWPSFGDPDATPQRPACVAEAPAGAGEVGPLRKLLTYIMAEEQEEEAPGWADWSSALREIGSQAAQALEEMGAREQGMLGFLSSAGLGAGGVGGVGGGGGGGWDAGMLTAELAQHGLSVLTSLAGWSATLLSFFTSGLSSLVFVLVFSSFTLSLLSLPMDLLGYANGCAQTFLGDGVGLSGGELNSIRSAFQAASVLPVTTAARHAVLCIGVFSMAPARDSNPATHAPGTSRRAAALTARPPARSSVFPTSTSHAPSASPSRSSRSSTARSW